MSSDLAVSDFCITFAVQKNLMEMKRIVLFILAFCAAVMSATGAPKHKIDFEITGLHNAEVQIAIYHGATAMEVTKVRTDAKGCFTLTGDTLLVKGLYLMVLPNHQFLEFAVENETQFFKIIADANDLEGTAKAENSNGNGMFFEFKRKNRMMMERYKHAVSRVQELSKALPTMEPDLRKQAADSIASYREMQMQSMREMRSFQNNVLQYNRSSLLAAIMNCTREITLPQNLTQDERWAFVRDHFFDFVNLADNRLPHIPAYKQMLDRYVGRELIQHPDSVTVGIDTLLNQILRTEQKGYEGSVYYFTLNYFFTKFQNTAYQGYDRIFTNMIEHHYLTRHLPKSALENADFMERVELRYKAVSPSCIGNHAPDLQLRDTEGRWVHTDSLPGEYTVLIFYDIECEHCAQVIETWKETLSSNAPFASRINTVLFYTGDLKNEWKEYVNRKQLQPYVNLIDAFGSSKFAEKYNIGSTPVIYVLNRDKIVIARHIPVSEILPSISRYSKTLK